MGRKPTGNLKEAKEAFGRLLQKHLDRGTRPDGIPDKDGATHWEIKSFAFVVKAPGIDGADPVKSVNNWLSGRHTPKDRTYIEKALFGPEPTDGTIDKYAKFRDEFRKAHRLARGGDDEAESIGRFSAPLPQVEQQHPILDPGECFGRRDQIARLVEALLSSPSGGSVLVLGNAGHGKTMLTQSVATQSQIIDRFGVRRWFVELERADSAATALAEIAQATGLERTAPLAAVQAALGFKQKPGLLVLDNLETPLHAAHQRQPTEQLLRDLVSVPGLSLMTSLRSQETIGSVTWSDQVLLHPLQPHIARLMFLSIAKTIRETDPDLDFFIGESGELAGIPLAIRLVAHCVFQRTTLASLRREWEKHGAEIARLAGGDATRLDDLIVSVEFSLKSSRLQSEGRQLFSLLGQLPAGLGEKDREILLGSAGIHAAHQLRAVGLLKDADDDRIGLLAPVRDVARRRHSPDADAQTAWAKHYLVLVTKDGDRIGKLDGAEAIARVAPEVANIGAAVSASIGTPEGRTTAVCALEGFGRLLRYTGLSGDAALNDLERACKDAGDHAGRASCLIARGGAARMLSRNKVAHDDFHSAESLLAGLGEDKLQADCLCGLAEIARMQSENEKARGLYEDARELYKRAGDLAGVARCDRGLSLCIY